MIHADLVLITMSRKTVSWRHFCHEGIMEREVQHAGKGRNRKGLIIILREQTTIGLYTVYSLSHRVTK